MSAPENIALFLIITLSVLAQTAAAWIALRQMATVGGAYRLAWGCVALALALMVERRLAPLWRLIHTQEPSNMADSVFGLLISLLMAASMYGLRSLFADLAQLAQTDSLTGLANRRNVLQRAQQEIDRAHRTNRPLAFLMFDIDRFKQVNDTYGHPAGDEVLRRIAAIARQEFRRIDTIGRIGGEEFLVVLPESDGTHALAAAQRLRAAIAIHNFAIGDDRLHVTISLGVVVPDFSISTVSIDAIMKAADLALYTAKNSGRNCVIMHNWPSLNASEGIPS